MASDEAFLFSSSFYHWSMESITGDGFPDYPTTTREIPIESSGEFAPESLPVALTRSPARQAAAAVAIQAIYRAHLVRTLVRAISEVKREADQLEGVLQTQETVDRVRRDPRERLRLNEELMRLLFRLDSVPGVVPPVRELRRRVSRKIVGLQEVLDAVAAAQDVHDDEVGWLSSVNWDREEREAWGRRSLDEEDENLRRFWGLQSALQL